MELLHQSLDLTAQKISNIEEEILKINEQIGILHENLTVQIENMRDTQRYLIKLAQNQQELTKRISTWPYIEINRNGGI